MDTYQIITLGTTNIYFHLSFIALKNIGKNTNTYKKFLSGSIFPSCCLPLVSPSLLEDRQEAGQPPLTSLSLPLPSLTGSIQSQLHLSTLILKALLGLQREATLPPAITQALTHTDHWTLSPRARATSLCWILSSPGVTLWVWQRHSTGCVPTPRVPCPSLLSPEHSSSFSIPYQPQIFDYLHSLAFLECSVAGVLQVAYLSDWRHSFCNMWLGFSQLCGFSWVMSDIPLPSL